MLFIAKDSIIRALEFENELSNKMSDIPLYPFKYRKSIYFNDESIRDFIFKGYVMPYLIKDETITILGITKYENKF